LGSRHHSLNMSEVGDVIDLLSAFEKHNQVRLEMRLSVEWKESVPDLAITTIAHPKEGEIGEVTPLGSVSVRCSAMNLKTVMGVLTHAMYTLDFQLACNELLFVEPKRAKLPPH